VKKRRIETKQQTFLIELQLTDTAKRLTSRAAKNNLFKSKAQKEGYQKLGAIYWYNVARLKPNNKNLWQTKQMHTSQQR